MMGSLVKLPISWYRVPNTILDPISIGFRVPLFRYISASDSCKNGRTSFPSPRNRKCFHIAKGSPDPGASPLHFDAAKEFALAQSSSFLRISLDAMWNNLIVLRSLCADCTDVIAVVKTNAYGHGDVGVASYLSRRGVKNFGVATAHEGKALRMAGLKDTILVLGNLMVETMPLMAANRLVPYASSVEAVNTWVSELRRLGVQDFTGHPLVVKVDSGLSRFGCVPMELPRIVERCDELRVPIHSVMTHLSEPWFTGVNSHQELERFLQVASPFRKVGLKIHASATGPILHGLGTDLEFIRPGSSLYGLTSETSDAPERYEELGLQPALAWVARPSITKTVDAGQRIGYLGHHTMEESSQIATFNSGYADGLRAALSSSWISDLQGRSFQTIGRIYMDSFTIKATDDVTEDTIFYIVKDDFASSNSVVRLSQKLNISPLEFCTNLGHRLPRVFTSKNQPAFATNIEPSHTQFI